MAPADDRCAAATSAAPPNACLAPAPSPGSVAATARPNAVPARRASWSLPPRARPDPPPTTPWRAVTVGPNAPPRRGAQARDRARGTTVPTTRATPRPWAARAPEGTTAAPPREPTPHTRPARGRVARPPRWPCGAQAPHTGDDRAPRFAPPRHHRCPAGPAQRRSGRHRPLGSGGDGGETPSPWRGPSSPATATGCGPPRALPRGPPLALGAPARPAAPHAGRGPQTPAPSLGAPPPGSWAWARPPGRRRACGAQRSQASPPGRRAGRARAVHPPAERRVAPRRGAAAHPRGRAPGTTRPGAPASRSGARPAPGAWRPAAPSHAHHGHPHTAPAPPRGPRWGPGGGDLRPPGPSAPLVDPLRSAGGVCGQAHPLTAAAARGARCAGDAPGAERPGWGAVEAAGAGPGVGGAPPTDALGLPPGCAPRRCRTREKARWGVPRERTRSSGLPWDVVRDRACRRSSGPTATTGKGNMASRRVRRTL